MVVPRDLVERTTDTSITPPFRQVYNNMKSDGVLLMPMGDESNVMVSLHAES